MTTHICLGVETDGLQLHDLSSIHADTQLSSCHSAYRPAVMHVQHSLMYAHLTGLLAGPSRGSTYRPFKYNIDLKHLGMLVFTYFIFEASNMYASC